MKKLKILSLFIILLGQGNIKSQDRVNMTIDFSKQGIQISPTLYGIFFEDINFAADGGLYAELIRNRSFEENTDFWKLILKNGSKGSMIIETQDLLNTAQTNCLKLTADFISAGGSVSINNSGFWGINVVDKTQYNLSFFAKSSSGFNSAITVSLVSSDGSIQYAQQRIAKLTTGWKKYTCTLVASGDNPEAHFLISINALGSVWFDVVSLFPPTFNNKPNGLRKDLAKKLEDLHPKFMRFPGGCFVEGNNMSEAFRWKQTIGPIEERPGHQNFWGYRTTDGMGYHEFLQLCEDIGAEPLYVCNAGMSHNENASLDNLNIWVQDAIDAIEYANGDTTTTWGHKRKLNGHTAPFNLKYIEIGNENGGNIYTSHYNVFYSSIKTHYPDIIAISNVNNPSELDQIDVYDDHYYNNTDFFAQNSTIYDETDRKGPKVYIGEYAVTIDAGTGNLKDAIGEAAFMTGLERNSDVVTMASYAPLFGNINKRNWDPDAIYYNSSSSYGTPSYYVQKMFSNNIGSKYIPVKDILILKASSLKSSGAIGVGTISSQCQFDSITIRSGDSIIVNENFNNNANGWIVHGGTWSVDNGVYRQTSIASTDTPISTFGNITLPRYTYHLKAQEISGSQGFRIILGYKGSSYIEWNIGEYSNSYSSLYFQDTVSGTGPIYLDQVPIIPGVLWNKWYDVRLEADFDTVRCYLNNKLMHNVSMERKALFSSCTLDTVNQDVFLKVVNFSDNNKIAGIKMKNLPKNSTLEGTVQTLTYPTANSENSITDPNIIAPVTTVLSSVNDSFQFSLAQNSVNIFHLYPQSTILHMGSGTFNIPENSRNGLLAGTMIATGGSKYKYSILSSTVKGAFAINDSTGEITVKDSNLLNYEVYQTISLSISVKDALNDSITPMRAVCAINLSDVNEKPTLTDSKYYAYVNDRNGAVAGNIFVQDEDKGQSYNYSIKSQSQTNLLSINSATGELTINDNTALGALLLQVITFTVEVSDNGSTPLSDEKEYTIEILDKSNLTNINSRPYINNFIVYPNPAGNYLTIKIDGSTKNMVFSIVDTKGVILVNEHISQNVNTITTSNMPNGIYYLKVLSNGQVVGTQSIEISK